MKVHDIKVVQVRHATPNWVSVAGNKLRLAWKATMNGFAKGAQLRSEIESRRAFAPYE